jgi:hypothetical protein
MKSRVITTLVLLAAPAYGAPRAALNAARPPEVEPQPPVPALREIALHVGPPVESRITVEHASVTFRDVGKFQLVTIAIAMTSSSDVWHAGNLAMLVPHEAQIVGMTYGQNGQVHPAKLMLSDVARQDWVDSTRMMVDPALLEQDGWTEQYDRMHLAVYPLSADQHASVEIVVAVPRADHVDVELADRHFEHRAGVPETPTTADRELLAGYAVSASHALYVASPDASVTAGEIRNSMLASRTTMFPCNFFRDEAPETDTHVVVHFTVGTDGKVTVQGVDHATERMASCITDAFATWQMRHGKEPVQVSYPLRFGWGRGTSITARH